MGEGISNIGNKNLLFIYTFTTFTKINSTYHEIFPNNQLPFYKKQKEIHV
jgi:hypothetical protein